MMQALGRRTRAHACKRTACAASGMSATCSRERGDAAAAAVAESSRAIAAYAVSNSPATNRTGISGAASHVHRGDCAHVPRWRREACLPWRPGARMRDWHGGCALPADPRSTVPKRMRAHAEWHLCHAGHRVAFASCVFEQDAPIPHRPRVVKACPRRAGAPQCLPRYRLDTCKWTRVHVG